MLRKVSWDAKCSREQSVHQPIKLKSFQLELEKLYKLILVQRRNNSHYLVKVITILKKITFHFKSSIHLSLQFLSPINTLRVLEIEMLHQEIIIIL